MRIRWQVLVGIVMLNGVLCFRVHAQEDPLAAARTLMQQMDDQEAGLQIEQEAELQENDTLVPIPNETDMEEEKEAIATPSSETDTEEEPKIAHEVATEAEKAQKSADVPGGQTGQVSVPLVPKTEEAPSEVGISSMSLAPLTPTESSEVPAQSADEVLPISEPEASEEQTSEILPEVPIAQTEQYTLPEPPKAKKTEPVQPAVVQKIEKKEEAEEIGIDTIELDDPRGNWLFKRIWWERAEKKYDKVRKAVETVMESRSQFFTKRAQFDKETLDPFYITVGLGQGELQEIVSELVDRLEQERQQEGMLNVKERDLLEVLQKEKDTLGQVKLDMEGIQKLDQEFDKALTVLMEQINRVRSYEREAWTYFKQIAQVLNDKKARELFYKIDVAANNIKDINTYINRAFKANFDKLLHTGSQQVKRIEQAVQVLKQKGLDLKKQADLLDEQEEPAPPAKQPELEDEDEDEQAGGWLAMVTYPFRAAWDAIMGVLNWLYEMVFGTAIEHDQDEDEDEELGVEKA